MTGNVPLLRDAASEIRRLRRDNEILGAQVRVVEIFGAALAAHPPSQGSCVDIAWSLDREADRLTQPTTDERSE